MKILVINGPNLNMLGVREPDVYGTMTLAKINGKIADYVGNKATLEFFQSNSEGQLIDWIQQAHFEHYDGLLLKKVALSHYSYALRDAISGCGVPCGEVHLANDYRRESFRHDSVTIGACMGHIGGFGPMGYILAMDALSSVKLVQNPPKRT